MEFVARSARHLLHFAGDKLDFRDGLTARGNLLVLANGRRSGEILLDARQTAEIVGGRVGSASPGMAASPPAAFRARRLLTLGMAARSALAKRHTRLVWTAVQAARVACRAIFHSTRHPRFLVMRPFAALS